MNIKKENIPVLVAPSAYVGGWYKHCIFSVYLEKNAFWKISHVCEKDMVIYTTEDMCKPVALSGEEYHRWTIQHNQLLAKRSLIDDDERKYLKALIKPFRDKVDYIMRIWDTTLNENYIFISCKDARDTITLPNFKRDAMYKGMKEGQHYTLDELGL